MSDRHTLEIKLRKSEDSLRIVGLCVIAFGIWSIIKFVLISDSGLDFTSIIADINDPMGDESFIKLLVYSIMAFFLGLEILFRLYIARSAIAEGNGTKERFFYIMMAFLIALVNLALMIAGIVLWHTPENKNQSLSSFILACVTELTSICIMLEMGISAIRVKKLRRQLKDLG